MIIFMKLIFGMIVGLLVVPPILTILAYIFWGLRIKIIWGKKETLYRKVNFLTWLIYTGWLQVIEIEK